MSSNCGRAASSTAKTFLATSATIGSSTAKISSAGNDIEPMPPRPRPPAAKLAHCASKTQSKKNRETSTARAPVATNSPTTTGGGRLLPQVHVVDVDEVGQRHQEGGRGDRDRQQPERGRPQDQHARDDHRPAVVVGGAPRGVRHHVEIRANWSPPPPTGRRRRPRAWHHRRAATSRSDGRTTPPPGCRTNTSDTPRGHLRVRASASGRPHSGMSAWCTCPRGLRDVFMNLAGFTQVD